MGFVVAVWLALLLSTAARAEDASAVLDQSRALETDGMRLLAEHSRLEEDLLTPDNDRLVVFLGMPHGARVIMTDVLLYLDDKQVLAHQYTAGELMLLQGRSTQFLYANRIPPGPHTLRLEVKTMQGRVLPMKNYAFSKGRGGKFVELQIAGYPVREVVVEAW